MAYVQYIEPRMPIFLFNYSDKHLHGIFRAVSCGEENINPYGWTNGSGSQTRYPAQPVLKHPSRLARSAVALPALQSKEGSHLMLMPCDTDGLVRRAGASGGAPEVPSAPRVDLQARAQVSILQVRKTTPFNSPANA
eukprot:9473262-Pyramimonas_sp.AAC.2